MTDIATLVADNIHIWTGAIQRKSSAGRGGGKRISLYGIERLRALILDLAVRGKLVPQYAGDEPASELLKQLAKAKMAIKTPRKSRQSVANAEDATTAIETDLPKSWKAVALSQIASIHRGVTYSKSDAEDVERSGLIGLLRGQNIQSKINLENLVYVPTGKVSAEQILKPGDIVIAMSSGSADLVGKAAQFTHGPEVSFGAFCGVIRPVSKVVQTYLAFFCKTPFYRDQTQKGGKGIGIQNLSKGDLERLVCPLPPLAEQQRIVAKVDELMALCDALERESADAVAAHQALVEALLATLVNSADAADLARQWVRLENHFDTLFTTDASIDALKQAILDLAVRGKLVAQDAEDEAAVTLLKRIQAEREKLLGGRRPSKRPTSAKFEMNLPGGWICTPLANIGLTMTGGTPRSSQPQNFDGPIPFIGPGQISPTGNISHAEKFISELGLGQSTEALPGDVLMVCIGGSIGKSAIARERMAYNQQINAVRPLIASFRYVDLYLRSSAFQSAVLERATGSATPIINRSKWEGIPVAIPPLAEQDRIVIKVDELMALCDALKASLSNAAQTQCHLADAITEQAAA